MENYSYSSYPDSHDSSPRSREIDENASWDEPPSNYKVKFMCSYGGKILPRPHDNQLTYVGGDTKILSVDRGIRFSGIIAKLSSLCDSEVCFKYQLPGEDLDALISVTNDEDLEHMMIEYDRLQRGSAKPARLRLFLFPASNSAQTSFSEDDSKANQQWFVDALNSVPSQSLDASSPPATAAASNPDFLFGLDKGVGVAVAVAPPPPPIPQVVKLQDPAIESSVPEPQMKIPSGSDSGRDDRHIVGEQVVSPAEIQRQIHELQRLQIANQEQAMFHRKNEEALGRGFPGDYYVQKMPEKAPPAAVPVPQTMAVPTAYWQDRHVTTGGYHVAGTGTEQQMYMMPPPTGMYQTPTNVNVRPVTGQVGQGYYQMQRMVPDVYRDQSVYSMGPPPPPQQQQQQPPPPPIPQPQQHQPQPTKVMGGMQMAETGYTQVGYDSTGRQVYYTAAPPGGVVPSSYPTVTVQGGVDARQSGPLKNQESKVGKPTL